MSSMDVFHISRLGVDMSTDDEYHSLHQTSRQYRLDPNPFVQNTA